MWLTEQIGGFPRHLQTVHYNCTSSLHEGSVHIKKRACTQDTIGRGDAYVLVFIKSGANFKLYKYFLILLGILYICRCKDTLGPIVEFYAVFSLISPEQTAKLRWAGPLAFMTFYGQFLVFLLYTAPPKHNMVTSLRERTTQNARSFKLSDRFERCANSFFWQFAHRSTLIFFHSENQRSLIAFERSLNI